MVQAAPDGFTLSSEIAESRFVALRTQDGFGQGNRYLDLAGSNHIGACMTQSFDITEMVAPRQDAQVGIDKACRLHGLRTQCG